MNGALITEKEKMKIKNLGGFTSVLGLGAAVVGFYVGVKLSASESWTVKGDLSIIPNVLHGFFGMLSGIAVSIVGTMVNCIVFLFLVSNLLEFSFIKIAILKNLFYANNFVCFAHFILRVCHLAYFLFVCDLVFSIWHSW